MALDMTTPRSRRAMLAAGLGGLAATVASALGQPEAARAASGDAVTLSNTNLTAGGTTLIETTSAVSNAFAVNAIGGGTGIYGAGTTTGVYGVGTSYAGVSGYSSSGRGIDGSSDSSDGVYGASGSHYGVYGTSTSNVGVYGNSSSHPGVVGHSDSSFGVSGSSPNGTGVYGSSGVGVGVLASSNATGAAAAKAWSAGNSTGLLGYSGDTPPSPVANTGVYGEADQDSTARGVYGKTTAGQGVRGEATTGIGGYFTASTGAALQASGKVKLNRSGKVSVAANKTYVDVTVPGGLSGTPLPFANLQTYRSGVYVAAVRPNYPTTGVMRIYLNKVASTTSSTSVSWLVLG